MALEIYSVSLTQRISNIRDGGGIRGYGNNARYHTVSIYLSLSSLGLFCWSDIVFLCLKARQDCLPPASKQSLLDVRHCTKMCQWVIELITRHELHMCVCLWQNLYSWMWENIHDLKKSILFTIFNIKNTWKCKKLIIMAVMEVFDPYLSKCSRMTQYLDPKYFTNANPTVKHILLPYMFFLAYLSCL